MTLFDIVTFKKQKCALGVELYKKQRGSVMAGKFEIYKDKGGEFRFPFKSRQWRDYPCK